MTSSIPLRYRMNPRQYEAMLLEKAAKSATKELDTSDAMRQNELDKLCARVPEYGNRAGYDDYRAKLGFAEEDALYFEKRGFILQPKQMEFAIWAKYADDPDGPEEIGIGGAKGGGKSLALMVIAALYDCQRCAGLKVLYLRYTAKSAKEQMNDLATKVFRLFPEANVMSTRIEFPNGSWMLIGGFNNDKQAMNYAGVENDILIVEEATQLSEKTHETLRGTNRSSKPFGGGYWRPRRYYSTNPLGIGHSFFKKRFIDNERRRARWEAALAEGRKPNPKDQYDPRIKFIFAKVEDNAFVNPEYVGVLESYTGAQREAYREGNWDVSAGAYFNQWSYDIHVISSYTDLNSAKKIFLSMDFGFNHWNVVHLHIVDSDGITITMDELAHRRHYPEEIAPDITTMLAKYRIGGTEEEPIPLTPRDLDYFLVGTDAFAQTGRGRSTIVQQYAELGYRMSRAEGSPGSRVAGAVEMSRLLGMPQRDIAPKWLISDLCLRLIECMSYLEIDPTNAEDVLKTDTDEQGRGGDDAYDCARYGVYRPHLTIIA